MNVTAQGGILAASSCSFHLNKDEFLSVLAKAAEKTGRNLQLIYFNGASQDHPVLPSMPETSYLKFAVFRVT